MSSCQYLAAAQLSFDLILEFIKERKLFGRKLAEFQNTQFKLAELRTELDIKTSQLTGSWGTVILLGSHAV